MLETSGFYCRAHGLCTRMSKTHFAFKHRKMLGKELMTLKHSSKCHAWSLIFIDDHSFSDVCAFYS